jgi:hypothetical protein
MLETPKKRENASLIKFNGTIYYASKEEYSLYRSHKTFRKKIKFMPF